MNVHTGFSPGESLESSVQTSSGSFTPAVVPTKVRKMVKEHEARARPRVAHSRAMPATLKSQEEVESINSSEKAISVTSSVRSDLLRSKLVLQRRRELAEILLSEAEVDEEIARSVRSSAGRRSAAPSMPDLDQVEANPFASAFAGGQRSNLVEYNINRLQKSIDGVASFGLPDQSDLQGDEGRTGKPDASVSSPETPSVASGRSSAATAMLATMA
jgi:hypothetical protein